MIGVTAATPGTCLIDSILILFCSNGLPFTVLVILISGSNVEKSDLMEKSRPLKTDKITTSANVPTVTPATDIPEMMLITFTDFFEIRYRRAI